MSAAACPIAARVLGDDGDGRAKHVGQFEVVEAHERDRLFQVQGLQGAVRRRA